MKQIWPYWAMTLIFKLFCYPTPHIQWAVKLKSIKMTIGIKVIQQMCFFCFILYRILLATLHFKSGSEGSDFGPGDFPLKFTYFLSWIYVSFAKIKYLPDVLYKRISKKTNKTLSCNLPSFYCLFYNFYRLIPMNQGKIKEFRKLSTYMNPGKKFEKKNRIRGKLFFEMQASNHLIKP